MKIFGLLGSLFAFAMAFYALVMDVTVPTAMGSRVVNIHLVTQQQNLLMISLMILIFGVVLIIIGRKSKESITKEKNSKSSDLFKEFPTEKGCNYKLIKKDGVSFKIIKEKTLEFYNEENFEIKVDNEQTFFIKNISNDAYIEVKDKGAFVMLSIWDAEKPNFIEKLYGVNKIEDKADKIIELSKMLEKGLISEDEFLSLKNNVTKK